MSDEVDTHTVTVSQEQSTWARRLMNGVREVQALHMAIPLWQIGGMEDMGSWREKEDALAYDEDISEDALTFFLVCDECARVERGSAMEVGYEAALWPCRTAMALGLQDGPVL